MTEPTLLGCTDQEAMALLRTKFGRGQNLPYQITDEELKVANANYTHLKLLTAKNDRMVFITPKCQAGIDLLRENSVNMCCSIMFNKYQNPVIREIMGIIFDRLAASTQAYTNPGYLSPNRVLDFTNIILRGHINEYLPIVELDGERVLKRRVHPRVIDDIADVLYSERIPGSKKAEAMGLRHRISAHCTWRDMENEPYLIEEMVELIGQRISSPIEGDRRPKRPYDDSLKGQMKRLRASGEIKYAEPKATKPKAPPKPKHDPEAERRAKLNRKFKASLGLTRQAA